MVVPTSAELAKKTRKLVSGGTAVDSVRLCTICDVVCNSQDVYNKHIAGRKHAAQVRNNLTRFLLNHIKN